MALNTLKALKLLKQKEKLLEIKRIINEEVMSLRNNYNIIFRHIDDFEFIKAIQLCKKCIEMT